MIEPLAPDPVSIGPVTRGRGFDAVQVDYAPGLRQPPHAHDTTTITLVLAGGFLETARGREESASALSVVVKPAGTVHADVVGPGGARTVLVEIHDATALLEDPRDLGPWRWFHAGPGVRPLLGLRRALLDPDAGPDPGEMMLELLARSSRRRRRDAATSRRGSGAPGRRSTTWRRRGSGSATSPSARAFIPSPSPARSAAPTGSR